MHPVSLFFAVVILGTGLHATPVRQGPKVLDVRAAGVGRLIDDVSFTDLDGRAGRLSDYRNKKAVVIALTGVGCPVTRKYTPVLAGLEDHYAKQDVVFLYVNPILSDDMAEQKTFASELGIDGPVVADSRQAFSRALQPTTTTEVFVLDAARTLVYRGAVSDQFGIGYAHDKAKNDYLRDALESVLDGRRPRVAATWAPGCALDSVHPDKAKVGVVTYHNRVSRILQANCLECHRKGGVGPFSLETYQDVCGNAAMIRSVVADRLMPPWFAAPAHDGEASPWANDRSLSAEDKADLLAWLAGGRPEGDPSLAPLPPEFPKGWLVGEPDHVFELPRAVEVKATGQMPYVNLFVETSFAEDRWIGATEIRPAIPAVVHHVLVYVIPAGEGGAGKRRAQGREESGFLAAYVPGNSFEIFDPGFGKKLPAGATLHFQMHYTPNGRAVLDRTRLGVKFLEEPPADEITVAGIADHRISIPPHASNYSSSKTLSVPGDVYLTGFLPHMHLRGKAFRYDLIEPGGGRETLLDIPAYDFNWQLKYELAEPRLVAAGSKIEVTGWFDNSAANPANPDPSKTIKWGPQTDDEMLLGYIEYYRTGTDSKGSATGDSDAGLASRFRQLDKDQDGILTGKELDQPALFALLDSDRNGEITPTEAVESLRDLATNLGEKSLRTRAGKDNVLKLFERLDRDSDGRLVRDELAPQIGEKIRRADLNGDGVLTRSELERVLKMRR
jgi:peroxiredoxin